MTEATESSSENRYTELDSEEHFDSRRPGMDSLNT